jgi:hypothetical protein
MQGLFRTTLGNWVFPKGHYSRTHGPIKPPNLLSKCFSRILDDLSNSGPPFVYMVKAGKSLSGGLTGL